MAESCTGGEVSAQLTDVPGISAHLIESAVTYSNESKVRRLGVPKETLEREGAVSAAVAEAMARGMRSSSGADLALGVTGIAGPSGRDGFQVSEIEFLGVKAGTTPTAPTLTLVHGTTPGTFTITSSLPAELYSTTNLVGAQWVDVGPITNSVTITATPGTPAKYYRVGIP